MIKAFTTFWLVIAVGALAIPAFGQPGMRRKVGGLPPFMASMERHEVSVRVRKVSTDGSVADAGAGFRVGIRILAGGAKVKEYTEVTAEDGVAHFQGIPSNPKVQSSISYQVWVEHQGVRFPYNIDGVIDGPGELLVGVTDVTTELSGVELEHSFIEIFPDEDALVVRHRMSLHNHSNLTVDLSALPGGGLKIPCPKGAKQPSLHDEHDPLVEVRGTDLFYKGALLPKGAVPGEINVIYTLPYRSATFEWDQTLPIPSTLGMVVLPKDKHEKQMLALDLNLKPGTIGTVGPSNLAGGRKFQIMRGEGAKIAAGEPLRFQITGVPARSRVKQWLVLGGVLLSIVVVFFGFRREDKTPRMSRAHLVAERDRLVRALARMRRAKEKGRISDVRFEREKEAITARLVSLYRALDRADAR